MKTPDLVRATWESGGGWYAEAFVAGPAGDRETLTDSEKADWPVDMAEHTAARPDKLQAALAASFPGAEIEVQGAATCNRRTLTITVDVTGWDDEAVDHLEFELVAQLEDHPRSDFRVTRDGAEHALNTTGVPLADAERIAGDLVDGMLAAPVKPVTGPHGDNPITDDQIREWESEVLESGSDVQKAKAVDLATRALVAIPTMKEVLATDPGEDPRPYITNLARRRKRARNRCAAAWNARHAKETP